MEKEETVAVATDQAWGLGIQEEIINPHMAPGTAESNNNISVMSPPGTKESEVNAD